MTAESSRPCCVCRRRLRIDEPQTCRGCQESARRDLTRIQDLHTLLAVELVDGAYGTPAAPRTGSPSSEARLPGGDILAMLGPGSARPRMADSADGDAESIVAFLGRWEDDWHVTFNEQAAEFLPSMRGVVAYLAGNIGRASQRHPAFAEFARDLDKLRRRIEAALHISSRPVEGAPCIDCGGPLVRHDLDEGGLVDWWQCSKCRRVVDSVSYWLSMRAQLQSVAMDEATAEAETVALAEVRSAAGRAVGAAQRIGATLAPMEPAGA